MSESSEDRRLLLKAVARLGGVLVIISSVVLFLMLLPHVRTIGYVAGGWHGPIFYFVLIGFVFFAGVFLFYVGCRRGDIDLTQCPICKYDLRGKLAAGCPECGWGRDGRDSSRRDDGM